MGRHRVDLRQFFGITGPAATALFAIAAVALFLNAAVISFFLLPRQSELKFLRLHYLADLGVDWIDVWWKILIFPIIGAVFFFINGYFSGTLAARRREFGALVLGATAVVEILLLVGSLIAVMLNS